MLREAHEGDYLKHLQGLPNVVELLAYSVVKIEDNNDTTVWGRQCSSGLAMTFIEAYYNKIKKFDFTQHSGTTSSVQEDLISLSYNPRQPKDGLHQHCDNREHRDVITAWVESSFNEGISSLNLLKTSSIWQQAFSAIKSITEKGVLHRDISFRNIRIDDQKNL